MSRPIPRRRYASPPSRWSRPSSPSSPFVSSSDAPWSGHQRRSRDWTFGGPDIAQFLRGNADASHEPQGGEIEMKKILTLLLIGMITLAPALVAAQTGAGTGSGSGAPGSSSGAGGSGSSKGGSGSPGATGSGSSSGSMSAPSSGSSSGSSPSASPSDSSSGSALSKITNQTDCKAAGGDWQASTGMCRAKAK